MAEEKKKDVPGKLKHDISKPHLFPTNWTNVFDFIEKNTLEGQITSEMKPLSYATKHSFLEMGIYDESGVNIIAFGSDNPFS